MKTTIKLGMLTAAFLLVFASCSNIVKDPVDARDSVAKTVIDNNSTQGQGFKIISIDGKDYGNIATTENQHYQVQIKFSYRPDKKTLEEGVKFSSLKDAANAYSMPQTAGTYKATEIRVADTTAYFTFDFKPSDVKNLYVFVDANVVKAENGAKLNHDGDAKPGEGGKGGDDSYARLLQLPGYVALKGDVNYDQNTANNGLEENWKWEFESSFTTGSALAASSDRYKIAQVWLKVNLPENTIKAAAYPSLSAAEESDLYASWRDHIKNFVQNHAKVQEYDWENGKWVDVTANFKPSSTGVSFGADVNIKDGRYARVKIVNRDKIPAYENTKWVGYKVKYATLKNNESSFIEKEIASRSLHASCSSNSGYLALDGSGNIVNNGNAPFWPKDVLTVTKTTNGQVSIAFNSTAKDRSFTAYVDNMWRKVTPVNVTAGAGIVTKLAGFEPKTVIKDNFRCYDAANNYIAVKDVKLVKDEVNNYPEAWNKIIILFEDNTLDVTTAKVYMSPAVKVATFDGSDDQATPKAYKFNSMSFANNVPPAGEADGTSPVELGTGWQLF